MNLKWIRIPFVVIIIVLIVVTVGCVVFITLNSKNTVTKDSTTAGDVLTVADLDKADTQLDDRTSDASVENLTKELTAQIDTQIAAKENPFEAVDRLAGVLVDTTNTTRQDQLTSFVTDFLAKHENSLWFVYDSEMPDQAQVNYWKGSLYAKLVYNYQFMMFNEFLGSDGQPVDTTGEQLNYINLYLALAQDPASMSRATEEYKNAEVGYTYSDTDNFIKLRGELAGK